MAEFNNAVTCNIEAGVALITLNRPESLNSLNGDLIEGLYQYLDRCEKDKAVRALVITGAGRGFCSGADLSFMRNDPDMDATQWIKQAHNNYMLKIRKMPKPVITAVNGIAAGGGMSIALSGDIVLGAQSCAFMQAFSKIGLIPDIGSTFFLPRYVGVMRATAMAMTAEKISAEDALRYGFLWKLYPDDQLMAETMKLAKHMATQPTRAYAMTKEVINASLANDIDAQLNMEANVQGILVKTHDHKEGVEAFLNKRPAKFIGR